MMPQPSGSSSWRTWLATQPQSTKRKLLNRYTSHKQQALYYCWGYWAREKQLPPPGDWRIWLLLTGRGYGKTRSAAEWVRANVEQGRAKRIAIVGRSAGDVRDVMIEGRSGLLAISPPWFRPTYEVSKRRLTWPNGAIATTFAASEPEQLRGPENDLAWCDEIASWDSPYEAWSNLLFGLRAGQNPRCIVTTTPKPIALLRDLIRQSNDGGPVVVTKGSTHENDENLADGFLETIVGQYEGTTLGRQELYGDLLDEAEGALWKRAWFDEHRRESAPEFARVVVAVDPAASHTQDADETGIVASALGADGRGYVLADQSGRYSPDGWARKAIVLWRSLNANTLVVEKNNGGEMVAYTIQMTARAMHAAGELSTPHVPVTTVWASQGKVARAEPVAALYEQGKISHVGNFDPLEDQCATWEPRGTDKSPDRLDALVWGLTSLLVSWQRPTEAIRVVGL